MLNNIVSAQNIKTEYNGKEKEIEAIKDEKDSLLSDISFLIEQKKDCENNLVAVDEELSLKALLYKLIVNSSILPKIFSYFSIFSLFFSNISLLGIK